MRKLFGCLGLMTMTSALLAGSAHADPTAADRATARSLAEEGEEALDKKDYTTASDRFARADALVHAPTLLLELARAQVGLRKFVEAQESYQRILREGVASGAPPAFAKAAREADKELAAIAPKLGWVVITVEGPTSPMLTIDDALVPPAALGVRRAVNPGSHVVKATAEGFTPNETLFAVREGDSATVSLTLERAAVAAVSKIAPATPIMSSTTSSERSPGGDSGKSGGHGSGQKTAGFVALGLGGAGLVLGVATGALAMSKHSQLTSACSGGHCPSDQQGQLDGYRTMGTISTIGFVVGAVGAAAGLTLLLTAPHSAEKSETTQTRQASLFIGPAGASARLTF